MPRTQIDREYAGGDDAPNWSGGVLVVEAVRDKGVVEADDRDAVEIDRGESVIK
jgi:hypothetical protein